MGAGVVTVGRRVYAVGLYWENSPSGRVSQTAKEAARQPGQQADFYAVRSGSKDGRVPQFGLGQTAVGHKAGMPVFAACLANQQPGSWAGAFRLREGTVVTVVRDDLIVPDGDLFFTNESEARDRLLQEIGFGGLQRIYAPESWAISGADTMPISLLLDERRDVRLRPVQIPKNVLIIGAACGAGLLMVLGVGLYMQVTSEPVAPPTPMLPDLIAQKPPEYPPPDRKWEKAPRFMQIVEACHNALGQVPAASLGWKLSQLKCNSTALELGWSREKTYSGKPIDGATITDTASAAAFVLPLAKMEPRGPESLLNPDEVLRRYMAQNWPGSIARMPDDPPPPPPPGYTGQWTPPPPPWIKSSFTVTVPVLPADLAVYFADLPGVVLNSVTNAVGGPWTLEGIIYENRI